MQIRAAALASGTGTSQFYWRVPHISIDEAVRRVILLAVHGGEHASVHGRAHGPLRVAVRLEELDGLDALLPQHRRVVVRQKVEHDEIAARR